MEKQLIFCVESNKKAITDYIYIKQTIEHFYPEYDRSAIRIRAVYMDGRGNYSKSKIRNQIKDIERKYLSLNPQRTCIVIYCFDCDDYDIKPEDRDFLVGAEMFCKDNGYRFVWFCKEVESVYLGHRIPDSQKADQAEAFARKKGILNVDGNKLRVNSFRDTCSNICMILDEYL